MVYDSRDFIEKNGCEAFPWSHNLGRIASGPNYPNNTRYKLESESVKGIVEIYNDPEQLGCYDQGDGTPGACPMSVLVDQSSNTGG